MTPKLVCGLVVSHGLVFVAASVVTFQCARHLRISVWPQGWRWVK